MKNIKIKSVIYITLICFFCTKLNAQNQWNLNSYHSYSSYIDLNCSLNGESNGTESFLFYADNRSKSNVSFTVNYTIIDNCGKSHSGSWSTYTIEAGQRASSFESVYTGCPIQKGKGHLVKNITCTVTNFKDLSKNEINTKSSTNTSANSSGVTTESASQRQYRQQQERIAETQRQSQEQSKEFVNNATELVGLVGNMFASNSADREKKEAKKEALREEQRKADAKQLENTTNEYLAIAYHNRNAATAGDRAAIYKMGNSYLRIDDIDESIKWFQKGIDLKQPESMAGMAKVYLAKVNHANNSGDKNAYSEALNKAFYWYEEAAYNGSVEALEFYMKVSGDWMSRHVEADAYYRGKSNALILSIKQNDRYIKVLKDNVGRYPFALHLLEENFKYEEKPKQNLLKKAAKAKAENKAEEAFTLYKKAFDNYYSHEAMYELGLYFEEKAIKTDSLKLKNKSLFYLRASGNLGNEKAMLRLAENLKTGKGITIDAKESDLWYARLEESKQNGPYIFKKADSLLVQSTNYQSQHTREKAKDLLIEAAELGNRNAMLEVMDYYRKNNNKYMADLWDKRYERSRYETFQEKPMLFLPEKALYSFVGEYESQNKALIVYIKKIGRELYISALINGKSESQEIMLPVDANTFLNDGFHLQFLKENGVVKKLQFIEQEGEKRFVDLIKVK
jgi:TPR repeat protein